MVLMLFWGKSFQMKKKVLGEAKKIFKKVVWKKTITLFNYGNRNLELKMALVFNNDKFSIQVSRA